LAYVTREMTSPEGPFYSTQDADSEGVEGKFYVWSLGEVEEILGREAAEVFGNVYDVTAEGNWEGHNILHRTKTEEQYARLLRMSSAGSEPKLNAYLEDYAFLLNGLVTLYEATFNPRWVEAASDLARVMVEQFWDEAEGGFFYTGRDHEALIARTKDPHDSS